MQSVSFKGIYAIPVNEKHNPTIKNYNKLMIDSIGLKDKSKTTYYSSINNTYYMHILDENDKKFEDYASKYGINYRKINSAKLNKLIKLENQNTSAAKELKFLLKAIQMGANYKITKNSDTKNVTLYDDKGENVFAIYNIDESSNDEMRLIRKTEFLDGKKYCVHEYDNNGVHSRTIMYSDENTKLEFIYDENGKPIIKK